MGRGSVRVAKRAREAGEEFEEMRSREVESKVMAERPDEQLFFVDRGQRKPSRSEIKAQKRQKYMLGLPSGERLSEHEDKLVKQMLKKQEKQQQQQQQSKAGGAGASKGVYDMWGDEEDDKKKKKRRKNKKKKEAAKEPAEEEDYDEPKKVGVVREMVYKGKGLSRVPPVHPGQSYNPPEDQRKQILDKALSVEEARLKALEEARKPLPAMSEQTLDLLLSSDDEDEEDGEEEEEEEEEGDGAGGEGSGAPRRRENKGKLTRADRNRIRRRKEAENRAKLAKKQRTLEKQANRAKELAKQIDRDLRAKKQEGKGAGGRSKAAPRVREAVVLPREKDPIDRRSVDVALTEELTGSLRLIHPVGSLATDQLEALQKDGRYEVTSIRKRQRPQKKIKYVEKKTRDD